MELNQNSMAPAPSQTSYRIGLSVGDKKAGLGAVDKEKVNRVIHDMSKNSRFFKNEQRKEQQLQIRINAFKNELQTFTPAEKEALQVHIDQLLTRIEAEERDLTSVILHVDMDAFYAAIEMRDDPNLIGKPMAVGGMGMLCTSNYEARKFGVRSAMPGFIGKELCPELIIVRPNFEKYRAASALTKTVYKIFDPNFLMMSLDEAYLNITEYCIANEVTPMEVASQIKEKILELTQLTCSIGIGPNRLVAKICTDMKKPNGVFMIQFTRDAVVEFMRSLHVRKISGIGKVTEKLLESIGITTCGQLYDERATVYRLFSKQSADFFLRSAIGIASVSLEKGSRKSMSHETTFRDISNPTAILSKCMDLCCALAKDVERKGLSGKNITVKLKLTTFEVKTRSVTSPTYISSAEDIYRYAKDLVIAEFPCSLRLLGVRMSHFRGGEQSPDPAQRTLDSFLWNQKTAKQTKENGKELNGAADQEEEDNHLMNSSDIEDGEENPEEWREEADVEELSVSVEEQSLQLKRPLEQPNDRDEETKKAKSVERKPPTNQKAFLADIALDAAMKKETTVPLLPAPVPTTKTSITSDKRFECPICSQLISALSTLQFQMHVERCLEQTEKKIEAVRPPAYAAAIKKTPSKKKTK